MTAGGSSDAAGTAAAELPTTTAPAIDDKSNGSSESSESFIASARSAGSRLGAPTALERSRASSELDKILKETPDDQLDALCDALVSDALREMRVVDCDEEGENEAERSNGGSKWHRRLGGATLAQAVVSFAAASEGDEKRRRRRRLPWEREDGGDEGALLSELVRAACSLLRDDAEPRVRLAAAGALGALAAATSASDARPPDGDESNHVPLPPVWVLGARDAIFDIVERDWDRDCDGGRAGEESSVHARPRRIGASDDPPAPKAPSSPSSLVDAALSAAYERQRPGLGELRHGTEGWRGLETAFAALLAVADGAGASFAPVARSSRELRSLVLRSLLHPNRFVREAGYGALGGICALAGRVGELDEWEGGTGRVGGGGRAVPPSPATSSPPTFADAAASALADGLSENWSQVRLAACVAARSLLTAAAADDAVNGRTGGDGDGALSSSTTALHSRLLSRLLPQLAFNRYDSAEGVRAYSNETWLLHTRGRGRAWVASRATEVFSYYQRCSRANNHMVREVAAVCVGELFSKVGSSGDDSGAKAATAAAKASSPAASASASPADAVRPLVPRALALLLAASRDDAWPVRDEGGRALSGLVSSFPEEVLSSSSPAASAPSAASAPAIDALVAVWRDNLEDNVPSVRDGGAVSMVAALEGLLREKARKEEERDQERGDGGADDDDSPLSLVSSAASRLSSAIEETIEERLPQAGEQPAGECAGAPSAAPLRMQQAPTAAPGKGYRPFQQSSPSPSPAPDPDRPASSSSGGDDDDQLFSASDQLLRRSRRDVGGVDFSCGCMDYGLRRPVEPWERSDGAARLLREHSRVAGLVSRESLDKAASSFSVALAEAARHRHYAAAAALRETAFRALPSIASNVGIRSFKGSGALEHFLGPLFDCLESSVGFGPRGRGGAGPGTWGWGGDSPRSVAAAGSALAFLRDSMGPRIFSGRLGDDGRRALMARAEAEGVVPPPAGAFAGVGGSGGGRGGLARAGVGASLGRLLAAAAATATAATTAAPPPPGGEIPFPPLGTGARPEGYCSGGMPLRK